MVGRTATLVTEDRHEIKFIFLEKGFQLTYRGITYITDEDASQINAKGNCLIIQQKDDLRVVKDIDVVLTENFKQ